MNIINYFDKNTRVRDRGRIKIYPDILLTAARGQNGGAAKLWTLAKFFNPGGCGVIPNKAFRQFAIKDLKIKRGTYDVWLARALHIKLFERSGDNLILAGYARAAAILGADRIGRGQYIELKKFLNKGWLSWVYAAWLKSRGLEGKQISRKTLEELSGIPARTQRLYSKQAGIRANKHYAKDTTKPGTPGMVEHINEFEREKIKSKAFLNSGEICWRLPNDYETKDIEAAPKGSLHRINRQLQDLQYNGGRDPETDPFIRLYNKNEKQANRTLKRIKGLSSSKYKGEKLPSYIYIQSGIKGFSYAIAI